MINIIRVGRERLKEAYEIVNKVDQGMNVQNGLSQNRMRNLISG